MAIDHAYGDGPLTDDEIERISVIRKQRPNLSERLIESVYSVALGPGDRFIDVGARWGEHAKPMARAVGPTGRGLAVEADPQAIETTSGEMTAEGLHWVTFANVAAFDTPGTATFHRQVANLGWSSLYDRHVPKGAHAPRGPAAPETFEVRLSTIDALVEETGLDACAFLKIDIEHAEIPALRGARRVMREFRPIIGFENSPRRAARLNKYGRDAFFEVFETAGYVVFDYLLRPMTRARWDSEEELPVYYWATTTPYETPEAFAAATGYNRTIRRLAEEFATEGERAASRPSLARRLGAMARRLTPFRTSRSP